MPSFKDKKGREWTLTVDVPFIRAAKAMGVDLRDLTNDPIAKLEEDPMLFADFLWMACKEKASAASITKEDFEASFGGAEFDAASNALEQAIVEFHPTAKQTKIREQLQFNRGIQDDGTDIAVSKMTSRRPDIRSAMEKRVDNDFDKLLSDIETPSEPPNGQPCQTSPA